MKAVGLFVPIIGEINEMMYQWDEPFLIDDRRFRMAFNSEPAEVESAALDTVTWAKGRYAAPKRGQT
jgi:hypothetical protein